MMLFSSLQVVEPSQVLFSLETLVITVSAGAVAALVVGFVTGYCCGRRCGKDAGGEWVVITSNVNYLIHISIWESSEC